jgi:hypothetical protein
MEKEYESLGMKKAIILQNDYGIKIYCGTKGNDDWCVEVPKKLMRKIYSSYACNYNYVVYLISEEEALRIADSYTITAKHVH